MCSLVVTCIPDMVTDPYCCRDADPDVAAAGSTGRDPPMAPAGISCSSFPLSFQFCLSSLCPIFLFVLFHFSTLYLALLIASMVAECLGLPQKWS